MAGITRSSSSSSVTWGPGPAFTPPTSRMSAPSATSCSARRRKASNVPGGALVEERVGRAVEDAHDERPGGQVVGARAERQPHGGEPIPGSGRPRGVDAVGPAPVACEALHRDRIGTGWRSTRNEAFRVAASAPMITWCASSHPDRNGGTMRALHRGETHLPRCRLLRRRNPRAGERHESILRNGGRNEAHPLEYRDPEPAEGWLGNPGVHVRSGSGPAGDRPVGARADWAPSLRSGSRRTASAPAAVTGTFASKVGDPEPGSGRSGPERVLRDRRRGRRASALGRGERPRGGRWRRRTSDGQRVTVSGTLLEVAGSVLRIHVDPDLGRSRPSAPGKP